MIYSIQRKSSTKTKKQDGVILCFLATLDLDLLAPCCRLTAEPFQVHCVVRCCFMWFFPWFFTVRIKNAHTPQIRCTRLTLDAGWHFVCPCSLRHFNGIEKTEGGTKGDDEQVNRWWEIWRLVGWIKVTPEGIIFVEQILIIPSNSKTMTGRKKTASVTNAATPQVTDFPPTKVIFVVGHGCDEIHTIFHGDISTKNALTDTQ